MKQLIKTVLYIACVALLGLILVYLMFDVEPNASTVPGAVVGAFVACLISLWFRRWVARRT